MKKAIEHDVKAIELDVQLTKDNHLIVIHDHKFSRFNKEIQGLVRDYTLSDIKQIDVGTNFSSRYKGVTLATLEEILDISPKDILLNIEIKNIPVIYEGIEEILLNCLYKCNRLNNIVISSFDHEALEKVQHLAPTIPLGMLFYYRIIKPWDYLRNSRLNIYSVHPHASFTNKKFIDEFHMLGCNVYPFTVNDEEEYQRLVDIGVDGVFSNNPKIFTKS